MGFDGGGLSRGISDQVTRRSGNKSIEETVLVGGSLNVKKVQRSMTTTTTIPLVCKITLFTK